MPFDHEQRRAELSQKLLTLAQNQLPPTQAALLEKFIPHFLASVDTADLEHRDINDLCGALLTQWRLVYQRKPGETILEIFNPGWENNGWHSTHTVLALAHDDMPFIVDSLLMELSRRQITVHIMFHAGGIYVKRDADNRIVEISSRGSNENNMQPEAIVYMEIDRQTDPNVIDDLFQSCQHILRDVELSVDDWRKMLAKVQETIDILVKTPPPLSQEEVKAAIEFLNWLVNGHFIFLGYREYKIIEDQGEKVLNSIPDTGLGVLRETSGKHSRAFSSMTPEAQLIALSPHLLIIAKSNIVSTVHRAANIDIIGVKIFDENRAVIGERRIVGLYSSVAYNSRPNSIPVLREKVQEVIAKSNFSPEGHGGKALLNILETLPRDDLFQASVPELLELSHQILYMQERRAIRLFIRKDVYGRFLSCLVYVPKERYDTHLLEKMQEVLKEELHAEEITYNVSVTDAALARIHFMVRTTSTAKVEFDVKAIEAKLVEVARTWQEDLTEELLAHFGEEHLKSLNHYIKAFPAGYRENNTVKTAVQDIQHLESLRTEDALAMNLMQIDNEDKSHLRFKLYRKNKSVSLFEALPMLENMGLYVLSEEPYRITLVDGKYAWISEFSMKLQHDIFVDFAEIKPLFQDAFASAWSGLIENDGFNRLILSAKLTWQEITILRAYGKYLKQIGFTFSQTYIEETFAKHANISNMLINLFKIYFDPHFVAAHSREIVLEETEQLIIKALDNVTNLDEDKILRRYLELIKATLRTNYFQRTKEGHHKPYLSFKFNPLLISDLPAPKPMFEIWVYSPNVEGVHLRSSKVARGGLRWSDRREDFRTEVLGLMKAQKVKNAVIVPSGAKGGFIPKKLPTNGTREEIMQEGINSYRTFIRGLLDITDNLVEGKVVSPPDVVRYDEDDPYLVVAADKGTATFSNFANDIAAEYSFWLDDAFASGGSTGYDHKKMGITARGAWESTKRHFRELGVNTQTENFTVVGIGDMAGDVFGNGMLQSRHIKLLAAFNHLHIFIDPNPDPEISFKERERMFNLPRSNWDDYNPELISEGGGVFRRSLKSIPLSPQIKAVFNIDKDHLEPNELIKAILRSQVDLLWNGGIGTFVKASYEINEQVGDKTNDNIRLNGDELNCRVVVEGGNLGFTQLGRVEYALKGGRIFTDFIDNSAGVDCSDHEVNIKILLNGIVANGEMTLKERNELLASMTDEVANLVLRNNYMQTQALNIAWQQASKTFDLYTRFMQEMSAQGKLDRELEFLPDDKELQERKGSEQSLTAPEIAILLAYSKMLLKEEIIQSDIPQDEYIANIIGTAFPKEIEQKYRSAMLHHSLRCEIIGTQLSNLIINYMGITFVNRIIEETGASIAAIVRAFTIAQEVFGAFGLWRQIEALDYKVQPDLQFEMMQAVTRLLRRATRWFLRNHRTELSDIQTVVNLYRDEIQKLSLTMPNLLSSVPKQYYEGFNHKLISGGVPTTLAHDVAIAIAMFSALDIIAACNENNFEPEHTAKIYFKLGGILELGWLRSSIIGQSEENHWDALGKAALRDDVDMQHRELTMAAIALSPDYSNTDLTLQYWLDQHIAMVDRWQRIILELKSMNNITFVMYAVAIREFFELTQASKQTLKDHYQPEMSGY